MGIPFCLQEQYPKALGHTVPEVDVSQVGALGSGCLDFGGRWEPQFCGCDFAEGEIEVRRSGLRWVADVWSF